MQTINKENLDFLYNLQYNPPAVSYVDQEIQMHNKPLSFKIYYNRDFFNLDTEFPSVEAEIEKKAYSLFQRISYMLWYTYGLTSYNWLTKNTTKNQNNSISFFRRSVASGGGLYPGELYIYIDGVEELETGLYYFDVSGPRLVLLRKGNYQQYIQQSLKEGSKSNIYIFLTSFYWKNYFKYLNFSYRLQGLDIGAIVGQSFIMAKIFGFKPKVNYLFDDNKINSFLGIDINEETAYAVLTFDSLKIKFENHLERNNNEYNFNKKQFGHLRHSYVPPNHLYKNISNLNCLIANDYPYRTDYPAINIDAINTIGEEFLIHQKVHKYDLLQASRNRISPGENFSFEKLECNQVQKILDMSFQKDIQVDIPMENYHASHFISIFFYANKVNGLPKGYYYFDQLNRKFIAVKKGDFSNDIQKNLTRRNFNLVELPLTIHVASNIKSYLNVMNLRGYRTLQMEAGRIMHQIQLNAASMNLGSHPMLSYQAANMERIFEVNQNILIQIAVGKYKPLLRLTNDLSQIKGGISIAK